MHPSNESIRSALKRIASLLSAGLVVVVILAVLAVGDITQVWSMPWAGATMVWIAVALAFLAGARLVLLNKLLNRG